MKHKHYDAIVAWANGEQIQLEASEGVWANITEPSWDLRFNYRVKPKDIVIYDCVILIDNNTAALSSSKPNIKFLFDADTGLPKSVELV